MSVHVCRMAFDMRRCVLLLPIRSSHDTYACMYACMYVCMYVCIRSSHDTSILALIDAALEEEYLRENFSSSNGDTCRKAFQVRLPWLSFFFRCCCCCCASHVSPYPCASAVCILVDAKRACVRERVHLYLSLISHDL